MKHNMAVANFGFVETVQGGHVDQYRRPCEEQASENRCCSMSLRSPTADLTPDPQAEDRKDRTKQQKREVATSAVTELERSDRPR
jgi:hypothetical protein